MAKNDPSPNAAPSTAPAVTTAPAATPPKTTPAPTTPPKTTPAPTTPPAATPSPAPTTPPKTTSAPTAPKATAAATTPPGLTPTPNRHLSAWVVAGVISVVVLVVAGFIMLDRRVNSAAPSAGPVQGVPSQPATQAPAVAPPSEPA